MTTPITASEVTIVLEPNEVAVTQVVNSLDLTAPGPQGPRGPAGADGAPGADGLPGAPGGAFYVHTQSSPAGSWVVQHNLNRVAQISVLGDDGHQILADIDQSDPNTASIIFATPTSGKAVVS